MFQPIHPRYQTLRRRRLDSHTLTDMARSEDHTLSDIYRRIDEDLAEL